MARRRRRRGRRHSDARALVYLAGLAILLVLLAHFWIFVVLGAGAGIAAGALVLLRRYARPPEVSNRVTHHEEMSPEQKARTRKAQRARVVGLGPNATETDRRMYRRDNPQGAPASPAAADDPPPF